MELQVKPEGAASSSVNPFLRENLLDPFPLYKQLREAAPIVWLEQVGTWAVFSDARCREVITDWQRFGSAGGGGIANYYREKPWREPSVVFEVDPPDHTRTRRILSRVLSPKTVRRLENDFAEQAKSAVADVVSMGSFDVVRDFARPFVLKTFPDAVGLPSEGRENLVMYNHYMVKGRGFHRFHWTEEELEEASAVVKWVEQTCSRDAISPEGLGAEIYQAADAGEISMHEANMLIRSFLSAGTDTTFGSISNTMLLLLQNPDQWKIVHDDPSRSRDAYEESLRYRSPAQVIARNTTDEMDFHGTRLGRHDKILAFVGAANRDPARWDNPDQFLVDRKVMGHLGLGMGIHGCVGQMIARMEAESLIYELARQVGSLRLGDEPYSLLPSGRGLGRLPVVATARH